MKLLPRSPFRWSRYRLGMVWLLGFAIGITGLEGIGLGRTGLGMAGLGVAGIANAQQNSNAKQIAGSSRSFDTSRIATAPDRTSGQPSSDSEQAAARWPSQVPPNAVPPKEVPRGNSGVSFNRYVESEYDPLTARQVRVTVQYLLVDDRTRRAIYDMLGAEAIDNYVSSMEQVETSESPDSLSTVEDARGSTVNRFRSPSRLISSTLSLQQRAEIVRLAQAAERSDVSNAPSVMLLEGKEAEINDMVQHPFVVDATTEQGMVQPRVEVFDEGFTMRMIARLMPAESITLACEIKTSHIVDVESHPLFGIEAQSLTVQVPVHRINTAQVTRVLPRGSTLLVDPYYTRPRDVRPETDLSLIQKFPGLTRMFRSESSGGPPPQHMLILLRPEEVEKK